ncbi:carbohydrate ABC transporter permease [Micrococcales bacterium 31B]|nr:carbohydrate ABC transporter permease [Micrococcales bacterium 31B]
MANSLLTPASVDSLDSGDAPRPPSGNAFSRAAARRRVAAAEVTRTRRLLLGNSKGLRISAFIVLALFVIAWLLPFLWAINTSLKTELQAQAVPLTWFPEGGLTLTQYETVLGHGSIVVWLGNTVVISLVVTVLTTLICAMAAYSFSFTRFRGQKFLFAATIALIAVPGQILVVPLFQEMLAIQAVDTFAGIILPQLIAPAMVFIFKRFFDQVPHELIDSARIDGAHHGRIFWSIVLPISRPITVAVAIFVFIGAWNNFMWPFIVTNVPALMTLPVGLATVKDAYGVVYAQGMASAMIAAVPLMIVFVFFQRHIVKAVATTGMGGM